jgi:hypothetical protein
MPMPLYVLPVTAFFAYMNRLSFFERSEESADKKIPRRFAPRNDIFTHSKNAVNSISVFKVIDN